MIRIVIIKMIIMIMIIDNRKIMNDNYSNSNSNTNSVDCADVIKTIVLLLASIVCLHGTARISIIS